MGCLGGFGEAKLAITHHHQHRIAGGETGGGKTTIATNLAIWLGRKGCDVLLVDADEQETATDFTIFREQTLGGEIGYTGFNRTYGY